ncbi:MAG TPA: hypothetical protein VF522_03265 [Ramlibacter sp.]|uniref:hypothetical protein n=1 Tax=Ramlibacter sp. TaxID=1917967 RepID=UPI002ED50918
MSAELDIRQWVDGWLRDHRAQLQARHVTFKVDSVRNAHVPKGKAVLRLEAPASLMQVDLWGSGEADVMELRHGNITSQHKRFTGQVSLLQFLDSCFRKLAAG